MKNLCRALVTSFLLLVLVAPAWAHGTSKNKKPYLSKNDTHYGHYHVRHHKIDKHKLKVLKQFREMKAVYNRSIEDARQMFLAFVGSAVPPAECDVQAVRDEYDQQIAGLNATIAAQQEQIAQQEATIASNTQQITQLNTTIASDQQQITQLNTDYTACQGQVTQLTATIGTQTQQIDGLNQTVTSQTTQINDMTATLSQQASDLTQCQDQLVDEYNRGVTDGTATCANTGPPADPQPVTSWNTGSYYPYAVDVNAAGTTYALDITTGTVISYDAAGAQLGSWTPASLAAPTDLAVDSQGNIFILDQSAGTPLMKFAPDGQQLAFDTSSTPIVFPQGLYIDNQDNVYVTDMAGTYGGRILKFDATGALANTFGEVSDPNLIGQYYSDVAVDETTHSVYIVTLFSSTVAKFNADGTFANSWQGDLNNASSIAIGAQGQVFVADTNNSQVDQYDADGNLMYTIQDPMLYHPKRVAVGSDGKLYIAGDTYQIIQVYQ